MNKFRLNLLLPETPEVSDVHFYTKANTLIAVGYVRVVIGERGAYIEFTTEQLKHDVMIIPDDQKWRFLPQFDHCYYHEYRTKDSSWVKIYHQRRTVAYANYRVGLWYISPLELTSDQYPELYANVIKHERLFGN